MNKLITTLTLSLLTLQTQLINTSDLKAQQFEQWMNAPQNESTKSSLDQYLICTTETDFKLCDLGTSNIIDQNGKTNTMHYVTFNNEHQKPTPKNPSPIKFSITVQECGVLKFYIVNPHFKNFAYTLTTCNEKTTSSRMTHTKNPKLTSSYSERIILDYLAQANIHPCPHLTKKPTFCLEDQILQFNTLQNSVIKSKESIELKEKKIKRKNGITSSNSEDITKKQKLS